jgi:hypothetical protein
MPGKPCTLTWSDSTLRTIESLSTKHSAPSCWLRPVSHLIHPPVTILPTPYSYVSVFESVLTLFPVPPLVDEACPIDTYQSCTPAVSHLNLGIVTAVVKPMPTHVALCSSHTHYIILAVCSQPPIQVQDSAPPHRLLIMPLKLLHTRAYSLRHEHIPYSATALSEPALYILLKFFCKGCLSKESIQVQGFLWSLVTSSFLWWVVSPTANHPAGGPPLVGSPRLLIQYICSYPPYLEAVSSIRNGEVIFSRQYQN